MLKLGRYAPQKIQSSHLKSTVCDNSNPGLTPSEAWIKKPHFALSQNAEFIQGHPTSVFCKISVRRSKYCLEFYITWGRLKVSRWSFHSCKILDACLTNSLPDFLTFNFSHFTAKVKLKTRKPKVFGFENVMERGIRKILTFVIR